jgi:hypothetical protein
MDMTRYQSVQDKVPNQEDYVVHYFYNNGDVIPIRGLKSVDEEKKEIMKKEGWVYQQGFDSDGWTEKNTDFRNEILQIKKQFERDALLELELHEHPNSDKIVDFAWEIGRHGGPQRVFEILSKIKSFMQ